MRNIVLVFVLSSLFGCASVSQSKVDELTHCEVPLAKVRRNLLKLGFGLKADEQDFINTDKRASEFGFGRLGKASYMVEATSPSSVKITTRVDSMGSENEAPFKSINLSYHQEVKDNLCAH